MAATHVRYRAEGWGVGELWLERGRLLWHELPRPEPEPAPNHPQGTRGIPAVTLPAEAARACVDSVTILLVGKLEAFFRGDDVRFDDVELEQEGWTPFQIAVADALRRVRRGETVTYGELADRAGRPRAHRAAGSFCARNPFPIVVPCHRVVAADGLGPYGSLGTDYKRRLLAAEGVAL